MEADFDKLDLSNRAGKSRPAFKQTTLMFNWNEGHWLKSVFL